jgi:hypothetical protein
MVLQDDLSPKASTTTIVCIAHSMMESEMSFSPIKAPYQRIDPNLVRISGPLCFTSQFPILSPQLLLDCFEIYPCAGKGVMEDETVGASDYFNLDSPFLFRILRYWNSRSVN